PSTVYQTGLTESFAVYMEISLICAVAVAAPWMLYQIWQFVAAGLYPNERKYVTKYMPFSIILLMSGMAFMYFVVLPITVNFLIYFSIGIKLPPGSASHIAHPTTQAAVVIPYL